MPTSFLSTIFPCFYSSAKWDATSMSPKSDTIHKCRAHLHFLLFLFIPNYNSAFELPFYSSDKRPHASSTVEIAFYHFFECLYGVTLRKFIELFESIFQIPFLFFLQIAAVLVHFSTIVEFCFANLL